MQGLNELTSVSSAPASLSAVGAIAGMVQRPSTTTRVVTYSLMIRPNGFGSIKIFAWLRLKPDEVEPKSVLTTTVVCFFRRRV